MLKIRFLLLVTLSAIIVGCGSAPPKKVTPITQTTVVSEQQSPSYSPEYYFNQAERAYNRSGDINLRNQWLLKSADAYKYENACHQSKKIVYLLLPEITDNAQLTEANLILAECELSKSSPDFDVMDSYSQHMAMNIGYDKRINTILATLYEHRQEWYQASLALLSSNMDEQQASKQVWTMLQQLPTNALSRIARTEPKLAPWSQLAILGRQYGLAPEQLAAGVDEWKTRFAGHPLALDFPLAIQAASDKPLLTPAKIAVLLPFTGRLANQGQAIKQGVLAAYFDTPFDAMSVDALAPQIQFFDSAKHSAEELVAMTQDYDLIIGPLLKDKLSQLLALLPADKPILGLNRLENPTPTQAAQLDMSQNRFFFALAPEDEAIQLAKRIHNQGLNELIVVADDTNATRRMADAFIDEWVRINKNQTKAPTLAIFNDNKSLTTSVTSSLDVAQSKSRIKQVENLITQELHSVPRNRRDVDALIVFANAEQTELINPLIEASLSPFGNKVVPVFASSRSYSLNLSNNSLRDLRNLTFTDMPWMLPENAWQELSEQTKQLWPQQNDQLRRLFALGYDSYNLVPWLRHLHLMPVLTKTGLTGKLSILKDGRVVRNLSYGHIIDDKVKVIAMD